MSHMRLRKTDVPADGDWHRKEAACPDGRPDGGCDLLTMSIADAKHEFI